MSLGCSASDPRSRSSVSLHSTGSQNEDWDRSESADTQVELGHGAPSTTPRNSVIFPADEVERTPGKMAAASEGKSERTISQLLRLHKADGTGENLSQDEALRIAEVLGQWVRLYGRFCLKIALYSMRR